MLLSTQISKFGDIRAKGTTRQTSPRADDQLRATVFHAPAKVKRKESRETRLGETEPSHEFRESRGEAVDTGGGKCSSRGRMGVLQHDPDPGPIDFVVAGADGACKLRNFETRPGEKIGQHPAGIVDEIPEALRYQDGIHVAGSRLLKLVEIVIRERFSQRNLDGR